jgi:hypothetical protein
MRVRLQDRFGDMVVTQDQDFRLTRKNLGSNEEHFLSRHKAAEFHALQEKGPSCQKDMCHLEYRFCLFLI